MYCKDCKKWSKATNECYLASWEPQNIKLKDNEIIFFADAADDSGLMAGVRTGPNFGCIRFEEKKK